MSPMCNQLILVLSLAMLVIAATLVGCATTRVDISPSPQAPVCDRAASALVFWTPQWRPTQKDVSKVGSANRLFNKVVVMIPTRTFTVRWQNGGPGVIKGVVSLPQDMRAALITALQPNVHNHIAPH